MTIDERASFVKQVRKWAGATSDAILDPSMVTFSMENVPGCMAYKLAGKSAIVFGDPVCPMEHREALVKGFHQFIENQGKSIIYVSVSHDFAYWSIENGCHTLVEYGKELIFDPAKDPSKETGDRGSLVRRKIRAAEKEKVSVHEYLHEAPDLKQAIEKVGTEWLNNRKGTQMHISNVYLFDDVHGKRWFYAKQQDNVIGVVCLNRLDKHDGWLMNHLMHVPEAPNGTSEMLITRALNTVDQEGCRFVTVGFATPKELGVMIGLGPISSWIAKVGFRLARYIAHLDGLLGFWSKYNPLHQPSYILFSRKKIGLRELLALKSAMKVKSAKD